MAELIVVAFHGTNRAVEVLDQLQEMEGHWSVDLRDAMAVYRDYHGTLKLDESFQPTEKDAAGLGALWGGLFGMLLAVPFTGGASAVTAAALAAGALSGGALGAATGALAVDGWRERYGLSEDFVRQVSFLIQPGDSAIFVLLRTPNPEGLAEQFRGYGGEVLQTTLTPEQTEQLQKVLDGHRAPA
jgi:uncharacterized membrane protein